MTYSVGMRENRKVERVGLLQQEGERGVAHIQHSTGWKGQEGPWERKMILDERVHAREDPE